MEFIRAPREAGECFLCAVGADLKAAPATRKKGGQAKTDRENLVIRRGKRCFCVMNRYPYSNGHLMIAPYAHGVALENFGDDVLLEMMKMLGEAKRTLEKVVRADGFNIGANVGRDAGAGVADHLHLHIVPRWRGDTNFMPAICDVKIVPQSLEELYDLLRTAWPVSGRKRG
jgi:ATP adenylyltransferase